MPSPMDLFLERNRRFAASDARERLAGMMRPRSPLFVVTCLDPRVDPAAVLGVELGDAMVVRNAGGRINDAVIADIAFIGAMGEQMAPDGPLFEVAVIHHTQCGTAALAAEEFRTRYAERTGYDPDGLRAQAVTDPEQSVRVDVERVRAAAQIPSRVSVSGHVYDLETGLVSVVAPVETTASATRS